MATASETLPDKKTNTNNAKYTSDGEVIEATAYNGQVIILSKTPEFVRDVFPYFLPSLFFIGTHILY